MPDDFDLAAYLTVLAVQQADGWRRAFVFDLTPQLPADYEVANWFHSTHPQIVFANMLIVERLTPQARYNLVNTRLAERRADGTVSERVLASADELATVLDEVFDLAPPVPAAEVFAKIAASP